MLDKKKDRELVAYAEQFSVLSTALYNACLFRIRQVFTGWTKEVRTENEVKVFRELEVLKQKYPSIKPSRVLSYVTLEKLVRAIELPEFSDGLPMQTAQRVVKLAVQDFKAWIHASKAYKKDTSSFTGKPKMPKYKKRGSFSTFEISNQDAVLYEDTGRKGMYQLKLPLTKLRVSLYGVKDPSALQNLCFKPFYGSWVMFLDYQVTDGTPEAIENGTAFPLPGPYMAGIDFGVGNIASIAVNDSSGLICKGGVLKSEIRRFCMQRAKAVSLITHGKEQASAHSKYLDRLSLDHFHFTNDQCHQISRYIVDYCIRHKVGILVLGVNKWWKQNSGMLEQNNQMFELMPIAKLRDMITYKAQMAGILVVLQEESYTSKADFLKNDRIPVYGEPGAGQVKFSGHRRKRGLYVSGSDIIINADLNGAANILRKAFPRAFKNMKDPAFLSNPEVLTFRKLERLPDKKKTA